MNKNIYCLYLFALIGICFCYDCQNICNVTISITENSPKDQLQWNLIHLLHNRTYHVEYLQFSLSYPSEYFFIESTYIKYRLNELDREFLCKNLPLNDECSLQLQIFTQASLFILFKLIILDENDCKPFFKQDSIELVIRENLSINYRVQLPIAYDFDSILYNIDHYEFIHNTNGYENIFSLEQTHDELQLKLLKQLDCELKNNYQLFIIAIDKGGLESNILHINVTVGDLNEYQPRFSQRFYHTRVPENYSIKNSSSTVLQVHATDDDCYDRIIVYSILNHDIPYDIFPFDIDPYTGLIYIKNILDYESISTYRFRIKASNIDQTTSSIVPIIIDILDVNDNPPLIQMNIVQEYKIIENDEYLIINISENIRLEQIIGTILIRDLDSSLVNHRLSLNIISCLPSILLCPIELDSRIENSTFSSMNHLIRIARKLDRESNDETFTIVLEANDYGNPPLNSQRRLIINVNDENDCVPKFTRSNYQFRVLNTSSIGFFIGQVQAVDDDYSSKFNHVRYKIFDDDNNNYYHNDILTIDQYTGSLFLGKTISNIDMIYRVKVIAFDKHNHSLYDQVDVEIFFYDENKCIANFNQTIYVFNTTEHQSVPYELGQVHINDCALSLPTISYNIIEDESFPFSFDNYTGIIKINQELDREIRSFYKFHIKVFNSKNQESFQTEVHINVFDKNDHYPVFNHSNEQYIYISPYDHDNRNTFITQVHAIDRDLGFNGVVNYYFKNTNHYDYFYLYLNGSIILYNRNTIVLPMRLEVYARDQGYPNQLTSNESIVIYICDIFKRYECPLNEFSMKSDTNYYLGSIFIIISIVLFVTLMIICIVWHLFIKEQVREIDNKTSYNGRIEARKNLIISDVFYDSSPILETYHRPRSVAV